MVTETQKRIEAYRELLPGLREKVTAVALLLALSVIMLASASYAWLTISRAPEVTAVSTNIAANGSLEIALATGDGTNPPGASKVGDSMAAEVGPNENPITKANITWGNLINLGDPSYGLDNFVLRPAQLNKSDLLGEPLYGAVYQTDGRIEILNTDFRYVSWEEPSEAYPDGRFKVDESVGVRGVASVTEEIDASVGLIEREIYRREKAIKDLKVSAEGYYTDLIDNTDYMNSLAKMMGLYMTARMNSTDADLSNPDCDIAYIEDLRDMYDGFLDAFDAVAETMVEIENLSLFIKGEEEIHSIETIYTVDAKDLACISDFEQFKADRNIIASDLEELKKICDTTATTIKWKDSGINGIVNNLVNVGECTVTGEDGIPTPINSIGGTKALDYVGSDKNVATITNGILYRFEERIDKYLEKNLTIEAKLKREVLGRPITVPGTVKAKVITSAPRDYNLIEKDLETAKGQDLGITITPDYNAQDTYALAVDFWVRTNAAGSYLTLEGNVIADTIYEDEKITLSDGTEVDVYSVSVTIEGTPFESEVYKHNGNWYNANTRAELTSDEMTMLDPEKNARKKQKEITIVSGYEGVNRVWDESELIDIEDPTTQGSGSCYVYYADTPEDQAKSLNLLQAMKVAFVNSEGRLLAEAIMDTEHHYAANGRVVVPLVLDDESINLGTDIHGKTNLAITPLNQNEATRITAIVYLDGTKLTNDNVLAAADIQGQLNIQFGSSAEMETKKDENLMNQTRSVSAVVDKDKFVYEKNQEMNVTVTVTVEGDEPENVSAFFLREINATQGSREEEMTFTKQPDGTWQATYSFQKPGKYVLRTVRLDGQEYELDTLPRVEIEGFAISSLSCTQADENRNINVMTEQKTYTADFVLDFAVDSPDKMPNTVEGRFLSEDGSATTINFAYNSKTTRWEGKATFISSGTYTLQYVVFDGDDYNELPENMRYSATLFLGMGVEVRTESATMFPYDPNHEDFTDEFEMFVKIADDTGAEQKGLTDVTLIYYRRGSIDKIDADLSWNGSYYVGKLPNTGPGVWVFGKVEIGKEGPTQNTLTSAPGAPTFTVVSLDPPEVLSENNTESYQFAPDGNATMNVNIKNSGSATVKAVITDGKTEETVPGSGVENEETKITSWNFTVPNNISGSKDGNWTLTEVLLENVFVDNVQYDENNPLRVEISGNTTKVVQKPKVNFKGTKGDNFGKDGEQITGEFAAAWNVSGIQVEIKDFEDQPLPIAENSVTLSFDYGNNSDAYGGYTGPTNADADVPAITFTADDVGITFTQSQGFDLKFAGSYNPKLRYTVSFKNDSGKTIVKEYTLSGKDLPTNAPVFTVSSVTPSVAITAISNYGSSTYTATEATVYIDEVTTPSGCGSSSTSYKQASVTITLSGYGKANEATLTFTGNTETPYMYSSAGSENANISNYNWSSNGESTRYFGKPNSSTGAGTLKATTLVLKIGNVSCEVSCNITISNPGTT